MFTLIIFLFPLNNYIACRKLKCLNYLLSAGISVWHKAALQELWIDKIPSRISKIIIII